MEKNKRISRKKYANGVKVIGRIIETEERIKAIDDEQFVGDIYYKKFGKVTEPYIVPSGVCIMDTGYTWLEFYKYDAKLRMSAVYNEKLEIVEWYFDLAREIGKEKGIPYEDDFYLDVVLKPDGQTILLDEDEFKAAFDRKEMTKEEYDEGYKIINSLIEKIEGKADELKQFTDKYLNEIM